MWRSHEWNASHGLYSRQSIQFMICLGVEVKVTSIWQGLICPSNWELRWRDAILGLKSSKDTIGYFSFRRATNIIKFISDFAGFDPSRYDGTVKTLIPKVMAWLATSPDAVRTPTPQDVLAAFTAFIAEKEKLKRQWSDEIPWADIVLAARAMVPM